MAVPQPITTAQELQAWWSERRVDRGPPTVVPTAGLTVTSGVTVVRIIVTAPAGGLLSPENLQMEVGAATVARFWVATNSTEQYDVEFELDADAVFTPSVAGLLAVVVLA